MPRSGTPGNDKNEIEHDYDNEHEDEHEKAWVNVLSRQNGHGRLYVNTL